MPPYDILPAIILALLILTTAGVILLRPISKQLARLLAQMASEKQRALETETVQIRDLVNSLDGRVQLLEERMDFNERLLAPQDLDAIRNPEEGPSASP